MTYANPAALVSTEWVADHLHDSNVRLFEVDVDTTAYDRGHLEGACGINWTTQLGDRIRRDIPSQQAWSQLMSQCGVSSDTRLVFYGDNNNWFAAFAYWVATIYGHRNSALMNGGRKKWELEQRPLTVEPCVVTATTYKASAPDFSLRAYLKDVLERSAQTSLVDVRSPAEFSGEIIAPPGFPKPPSAAATFRAPRTFRGPRRPMKMARSRAPRSCSSCTATRASPRRAR